MTERTAPALQTAAPKPQGFDPGLQCLAAVLVFTLAVRFGLGMLAAVHSTTLLKLGLAVVVIGVGVLIVVSAIVWGRRRISARPPRRWAVLIAMIWSSLQLLFYLLVPLQTSSSSSTSADQVGQAFEQYKQALLAGDGETAWNIVDAHTKQFYAQAVTDAMSLRRIDLERLDFVHRFMVLRTRIEFRKPALENLSGHDLFIMAVTNGWISRSSVERVERFQSIGVKDQYATAYLPQAPRTPAFHFINEDGEWKLSLWKSFEAVNAELQRIKQESRLSERDFMIDFLRRVSRYEVTEQIFHGPLE